MAEDQELTENLTGTEKSAILMMLLGEDEAAAAASSSPSNIMRIADFSVPVRFSVSS